MRFKRRTFYISRLKAKLILAYQKGPETSLDHNEPKQVALNANSNTTSEHAPLQMQRNY